ncbi:MAG: hypothetical protein H0U46_04315 [Actinobacteria bacterium]|nr:hypothetical protein [Actinomycetota bacterium]
MGDQITQERLRRRNAMLERDLELDPPEDLVLVLPALGQIWQQLAGFGDNVGWQSAGVRTGG